MGTATQPVKHTPGLIYTCKKCGWEGPVNGRPRCLACYAKRTAAWRKDNRQKALLLKRRMDKKMRTERPAKAAEKKRGKRSRNKSHYSAKLQERLAWLRGGDVTRGQLIEIYKRDGGVCSYCGVRVRPRFTPTDPRGFDHVTPRSCGGLHTISNMVVCCGRCNAHRSDIAARAAIAKATGAA